MNTAQNADLAVANAILAQLGGHRFIAMTGAKNVVGDATSLTMRLGRGAKDGINCLKVTLERNDTYTVQFYKIGRAPNFSATVVSETSFVYNADLRRLFESVTGLRTSL